MFKNLMKTVTGIATLPLDVAADVVTMGGALSDKDQPYTAKKFSDIVESASRAADPDED